LEVFLPEEVRQTLEALVEVQGSEVHYFSSNSPAHDQALIEGLGLEKDAGA